MLKLLRPIPNEWINDPDVPLKTRVAAETDPSQAYRLGLDYLRGEKVRTNVRLAAYWLKKNSRNLIKKGTKAQPKEGGAVVPPLPTEAEPCVGALAPTPFL